MSNHFHGRGSVDPGSFQIPASCSPEVMRDLTGKACRFACRQPRASKRPDWLSVTVKEPRDDQAFCSLQDFGLLNLPLQCFAKHRSQRKISALVVFCLTWLQPEPSGVEVEVVPLSCQDLIMDTPACHVS